MQGQFFNVLRKLRSITTRRVVEPRLQTVCKTDVITSSGKGFSLRGPTRALKLNSVDVDVEDVGHPRDRQELTDDWCE